MTLSPDPTEPEIVRKSYDPKCLELARYFMSAALDSKEFALSDYGDLGEDLAQRIQTTVEDYFSDLEEERNYERDR